jgi:fructokinase
MMFRIVGIGEVLWDLLPGGKKLGGAPANFAYHAKALGADAWIISRVGNDENGREIIAELQRNGVPTECIEEDHRAPTGTVSVDLGSDGQPQYTIHENVAWDKIKGQGAAERAVKEADAVCFGTLAQRSEESRRNIRRLLEMAPEKALRVLDVNLRQNYFSREIVEGSLQHANALKVNEGELPQIGEMFGLRGEAREIMKRLAEMFGLKWVACTRGERGSLLLAGNDWSEHPGVAAKVVDTIGAGDSFTAAMVIGILAGWELDKINERANRVAAYVASQSGAMPELPEEIRKEFRLEG